MRSCEFELDPSEVDRMNTIDDSKLDKNGKWQCPHSQSNEDTYCLFHSSKADTQSIKNKFLRIINTPEESNENYSSPERRLEFIGASFDDLILRYTNLSTHSNQPIDLRYSKFSGKFDISYSQIQQPLKLDGCDFENGILAIKSTFHEQIDLMDGRISECAENIDYNVTAGELYRGVGGCGFPGTRFLSEVRFTYTRFEQGTFFNSTFESEAEFTNVVVSFLDMGSCIFNGMLKIDGSKIDKFELTSSICNREFYFGSEGINSLEIVDTTFNESVLFRGVAIHSCDSDGAEFNKDFDLIGCTIHENVAMSGAKFYNITIQNPIANNHYSIISFEDSDIISGKINLFFNKESDVMDHVPKTNKVNTKDDEIILDITGANVGDIDIYSACDSIWKSIIVSETNFDGFKFQNYIKDLEIIDYNLHIASKFAKRKVDDYSIKYQRIKKNRGKTKKIIARIIKGVQIPQIESDNDQQISTYLQAKNGATKAGDLFTSSEFFIREYYFRQQQAKLRIFSKSSYSTIFRSALRWGSYGLLATTSTYGERTRRVGGFSIAIILIFSSMLFFTWEITGSGPQPPYNGYIGSLLLSIESFTTLVHGGTVVNNILIRLIGDIEGFIGAFLIALFVFTLTRSIHR